MSNDKYQDVFRKVIEEAYNKGNTTALYEYFKPDFIENQFGVHATIEGMSEDIRTIRRSFPDFNVQIEDIATVGDKVWARMTAHGTDLGGFMGPPTGKSVRIAVFDQVRFEDGKIVEHWGSPDRFAVLAQLGRLPKM